MNQTTQRLTTGVLAAAVLCAVLAACNDAPSEPRTWMSAPRADQKVKTPADRSIPEVLSLQSQTTTGTGAEERAGRRVTTTRGIAALDASLFGRAAADLAPVQLRVWDAGTRGVPHVRRPRMTVRLPDNRVALVERESSPDGTPTTMRVRVGDREFIWRRSWTHRNGMRALESVEVESRVNGRLVAHSRVTVTARQVASLRARRSAGTTSHLLAISRRFGSVAGTVLLPRLLQAQTDGMACNGAATALEAAWTAWRISTVVWFASMVTGGVLKATLAELSASAAVDVAEANYIDCYVAAVSAGVPDSYIAPPPVVDEP